MTTARVTVHCATCGVLGELYWLDPERRAEDLADSHQKARGAREHGTWTKKEEA